MLGAVRRIGIARLIVVYRILINTDKLAKVKPEDNPYTPNAGARPPVLAGRTDELRSFGVLLKRLSNGYTEQSMIVVGLRGVGKTVLLTAFEELAREAQWVTVEAEITKHDDFGGRMAALARRALLEIAPSAKWKERSKRAAQVLRSFQITVSPEGSVTAGLGGVDPLEGFGDTGDLADDLTDVFVSLGEAAREHATGVVFLFDEIQFLELRELEALIAALHKTVQRSLPITFVGAGLPQLPELAGEAKSYAERLFKFPTVGVLPEDEATTALIGPAQQLGVEYTSEAVEAVLAFTEGYPYFLQEYGFVLWTAADESPIDRDDVGRARELVEAKLDGSFFRVRADRTTELELQYLRAMAELGPEPHQARAVADVLGRKSESLGPTRARLIEKGLLYTPGYGLAAFTVPQFDQYMRRAHELDSPPKQERKRT